MKNKKLITLCCAVAVLAAGAALYINTQNHNKNQDSETERMSDTEQISETEQMTETEPMTDITAYEVQIAGETENPYIVTVVEPTCEEGGYTMYEDKKDGSIRIKDEVEASGHVYKLNAEGVSVCEVCGQQEEKTTAAPLPRICLDGSMEGMGKKERKTLSVSFQSGEEQFECFGSVSWQGHLTLNLPKKNYTVRLFNDEELTDKHRLVFENWELENKYILKANYWDVTQCRNLVAADIWREMTDSRPNLPEEILNLPTRGAVDGFPVELEVNGHFFGLYDMNLHKDNNLYGMNEGYSQNVMICNAHTMPEAEFREEAAFGEDSDWELEFCGQQEEAAQKKFNELIRFVSESSDKEFQTGLQKYLDVDGAIDYLIYIYALGLHGSGTKDLVLLDYGKQWIPTVYDMETAFGKMEENQGFYEADTFLPAQTDDGWNSGTDSLLWDRLLTNYTDRIVSRYQALRQDILTENHLTTSIDQRISAIPSELYEEDLTLYPREYQSDDPVGEMCLQMKEYISHRFVLLDERLRMQEVDNE